MKDNYILKHLCENKPGKGREGFRRKPEILTALSELFMEYIVY